MEAREESDRKEKARSVRSLKDLFENQSPKYLGDIRKGGGGRPKPNPPPENRGGRPKPNPPPENRGPTVAHVKPLPPQPLPRTFGKRNSLYKTLDFSETDGDLYSGKSELRIALVGKTGSGKSACGNTILGQKEFDSRISSESVTVKCKREEINMNGRKVVVVDTPGLFDTVLSPEVITQEIGRCITVSAPGPHALVLVLQIGRHTQEEKDAVEKIQDIFGNEAMKYMIILFTHRDDLENDNITMEQHLSTCNKDLQGLIEMCGNRYCAFNNWLKEEKSQEQVSELIVMIDEMVQKNDGRCFTNDMYKQAEQIVKEKETELKRQYEERFQREIEILRLQFEEKLTSMRLEMEARETELKKELEKKYLEEEERETNEKTSDMEEEMQGDAKVREFTEVQLQPQQTHEPGEGEGREAAHVESEREQEDHRHTEGLGQKHEGDLEPAQQEERFQEEELENAEEKEIFPEDEMYEELKRQIEEQRKQLICSFRREAADSSLEKVLDRLDELEKIVQRWYNK